MHRLHFLVFGCGGVFASGSISLSAAECFSSAAISRALLRKSLDCSGSSRIGRLLLTAAFARVLWLLIWALSKLIEDISLLRF
jgi:hypothetical protein